MAYCVPSKSREVCSRHGMSLTMCVDALMASLSQAKADLAKEREGKCDWHLPSCHVFAQEQKARAERAEAELEKLRAGFTAYQSGASERHLADIDRLAKSEALAKEQERVIEKLRDALDRWQFLHDSTPLDSLTVEDIEAAWNQGKKALTPEPAKEDGNNG